MMEEVGVGSAFEVQVIRAVPIPTTADWITTIIFFALLFGGIYLVYKRLRRPQSRHIDVEIKEETKWRR